MTGQTSGSTRVSRGWLGQSTGGKYTLGLSLLAAYLLIVILDARGRGNLNTGDSNNLVQGARSALECLGAGDFVGCGHLTGSIQTEVFPYPLLQYLPAGFLVRLGFSDGHVLEALGIVSFVALVIALAGVLVTFRNRPRHAALALLALVGSSAIYQSTSAFGESLVASLVVLAVCAGSALSHSDFRPRVHSITRQGDARSLRRGPRPDLCTLSRGSRSSAKTTDNRDRRRRGFRHGTQRNVQHLPIRNPAQSSLPRSSATHPRRRPEARVPVGDFGVAVIGRFWFWPFFSAIAVPATAIEFTDVDATWGDWHVPPMLAVTGISSLVRGSQHLVLALWVDRLRAEARSAASPGTRRRLRWRRIGDAIISAGHSGLE